ncbi:MAG: hypothetical protein IJU61_00755 [Victivallales bacterium]|nr:hypothetical protein [Victivallales bacterium]MBQ9445089.1 hypothetical protein [Victivallales bacterium]
MHLACSLRLKSAGGIGFESSAYTVQTVNNSANNSILFIVLLRVSFA